MQLGIMGISEPQRICISGLLFTLITLKAFGFDDSNVTAELFFQKPKIIRMGFPPMRLEISTSISGVKFNDCYAARIVDKIDGIEVNVIDLKNLKKNKNASGRLKDKADLEQLP